MTMHDRLFSGAMLALSLASVGLAPVAWSREPANANRAQTPATLLAFEDSLFKADVDRNVAAIVRGFAPTAVFVHANGLVQTKADYIAAVRAGAFTPSSVIGSDRSVRISGAIGLVRGTKALSVGTLRLSGTYLTAYLWNHGRWQMLWSQSSPAAPTPAEQK